MKLSKGIFLVGLMISLLFAFLQNERESSATITNINSYVDGASVYTNPDTLTETVTSSDTISVLRAQIITAQLYVISQTGSAYAKLMGSTDGVTYTNLDAEGDSLTMDATGSWSITYPYGTGFRFYYISITPGSALQAIAKFRVGG